MTTKEFPAVLISLLLSFMFTACGIASPSPTARPTSLPPTNTPEPSPTAIPLPTNTPQPTATPDVAATQKAEDFQNILASFQEKGYIGTTDGESIRIRDFKGEHNQLNHYYQWWWQKEVKGEFGNFVFSAHLAWGSYSSTPEVSGCGIGFGIKENGDHYALFVDREHLVLARGKGTRIYLMGTAGGEKYPTISIPAEADFAVAVTEDKVAVTVNGRMTYYILSSDQTAQGRFAFSVLAGTNGGFGTRCEMTDIVFWTPK